MNWRHKERNRKGKDGKQKRQKKLMNWGELAGSGGWFMAGRILKWPFLNQTIQQRWWLVFNWVFSSGAFEAVSVRDGWLKSIQPLEMFALYWWRYTVVYAATMRVAMKSTKPPNFSKAIVQLSLSFNLGLIVDRCLQCVGVVCSVTFTVCRGKEAECAAAFHWFVQCFHA